MKRILIITTLALSVMLFSSTKNTASAQQVDYSISQQTFYDELSPHGQWIDYPDYGYVWGAGYGSGFSTVSNRRALGME